MSALESVRYLAIGHVTRDCLPEGSYAPGGTALYAAATVARLGVRAAVLTATNPAHVPATLPGVTTAGTASAVTTTFENRYDSAGRRQWLHALAPPIRLEHLPAAWRGAPVVHLAPVAGEVDLAWAAAFPHALVGVTPQGWLRAWDAPLPAPVRPAPWRPAPALLRHVDLLVLSIEDVGGNEALVRHYARLCPLVAVTRGAAGATLYVAGEPRCVPPFPALEHDPTGAGDVFAAALLLRLWETGDALAAATYASAAAACAVEGPGLAALPDRLTVERRLLRGTSAPVDRARWLPPYPSDTSAPS